MTGTHSSPSEPGQAPDDDLARARQLLGAGRLDEALAIARALAEGDTASPDALYLQAVAERYLGRAEAALATVTRLKALEPRFARAYQEEGHLYKARGEVALAIAAYRRAVELNRGLIASWRELATLESRQGNPDAHAVAQAEYRRLAGLPPELVNVTSLIQEGKLFQAERLCREFLRTHPHHIEAMRLLARLGMKLFIYDDAEFLLESCVKFAPGYWLARKDYVEVLHRRQKFEPALAQAALLRDRFPGNPAFELGYANELVAVGQFDRALEIYDRVIADHVELDQPHRARGHVLKTVGRFEEAIESYRNAYRTRPDFGDAYWSLANLKTYRFTDDEIAAMDRRLEDPQTGTVDRFHLCFALGKAWEDRENPVRSFAYYEQGNRLRRQDLRYDPDRAEAAMTAQAAVCTAALFERHAGVGAPDPDPIFIVGLPRSGSTLLEQILASHSQVDGTMELPNVIALAHRLNGRQLLSEEARYPQVLGELAPTQIREFGDAYIEDTRFHRGGAPRFIDKMPNNFMHVGLIHLILPKAKIVDARRHPMACCFSNFKQLFADGQEFTYDLEEMARYYRGYAELMEHWDRVLPGRILRVRYEQVVADLDSQVRRILDFLDLPFEQACLDFHRTERSVRTPSSEQVRQPIYQGGLGQWRNFEPYLTALKDRLSDLIDSYPS
ncbi:MAG: tetratricopeptide repeat-containing sulfotransferase family protein [Woeseiaceae bacterium]